MQEDDKMIFELILMRGGFFLCKGLPVASFYRVTLSPNEMKTGASIVCSGETRALKLLVHS